MQRGWLFTVTLPGNAFNISGVYLSEKHAVRRPSLYTRTLHLFIISNGLYYTPSSQASNEKFNKEAEMAKMKGTGERTCIHQTLYHLLPWRGITLFYCCIS